MRRSSWKFRILLGIAIVLFAYANRCTNREENPYTGRIQNIDMTTEEEIAIGLQSAPQMAQEFGGLHPNRQAQAMVDAVGDRLVENSIARDTPYEFEFHLLTDDRTVNADKSLLPRPISAG